MPTDGQTKRCRGVRSGKLRSHVSHPPGDGSSDAPDRSHCLAAELLPEEQRGAGFGLLGTVNGVGDLVSSVVVGAVWTRWSPTAAFWYAAGMTALGALKAAYRDKPLSGRRDCRLGEVIGG